MITINGYGILIHGRKQKQNQSMINDTPLANNKINQKNIE